MPHSRRRFGALALAALFGLGAGCSGADDSSATNATAAASTTPIEAAAPTSTPASAEGTTTTSVTAEPSAPSSPGPVATVAVADSVLDAIADHPDLSNFARLVASPDVRSVFTQARGVTVFAPDDDGLSAAVVDVLLADANARNLFLGRHLLIGTTKFTDLGTSVTTANGDTFAVDQPARTVAGIVVVEADITASNGVVHVLAAPLPDTTSTTATTT